ncbi:Hypothetical protein PHPALM_14415 [Phytophthora palmivora]|uniref:Uncharacterized protein n=1 Tax=Phytophthora palmivora TaxID=4796 RepID=A0A2P4XV09_9STRA|nr:Hypothetical protein PHPALM_14415 [Phytophthora palmivora]
MKMRVKLDTGSYTSQFEEVLQRIWRVLTTVCYTIFGEIFEEESMSVEQSCYDFQKAGIRQLRAVAKREQMLPETVEKGLLSRRPTATTPNGELRSATGSSTGISVDYLA